MSDRSPKPGLFEELKRRNVFRVAAMYAVVGWSLSPGVTVEGQRQAYDWYSVDDGGIHFQTLWTALLATR